MTCTVVATSPTSLGNGRTFETSPVRGFGEVSIAARPCKNGRNTSILETGTAHAVNYLILGVAAHLLSNGTGRGGARNRADCITHALSIAHVRNLIEAAGHASAIGLPFTRMITIHWETAGVSQEGMAKATGQFIELMTKALARYGSRTAWLWVHENGPDKGGHCHLLVHIPAEHVTRLTGLAKRWLRRITGRPYKKRVIRSKPIGGRLGSENNNPEHHAINSEVALGYVLKGATIEAAEAFKLGRLESGGMVIGKRCGTSQNIGRMVRRKAGASD